MLSEAPPESHDPAEWARWAGEASQRRLWDEALARWQRCIEAFESRPYWLAQKGHALRHLGRLDEAEKLFQDLAADRPRSFNGLDGLAYISSDRGDHQKALAIVERCLEQFPDGPRRGWRRFQAQLLLKLERNGDAETLLRSMIDEGEATADDKLLYARTVRDASLSLPDRAARQRELARFIGEQLVSELPRAGMQMLATLGSIAEMRAVLQEAERRAWTPNEIEGCMMVLPRVMPRGSCGATWERLRIRAREIGAHDLELRLLVALERFEDFVQRYDAVCETIAESTHFALLKKLRGRLARPRHEVFAEGKAFGIGLSRTGTSSLSKALEMLGFDSVHWTNPLTYQLLSDSDFYMFGAATDCCVSPQLERLYYLYPNARFVWTRRPFASWLPSFEAHHALYSATSSRNGLRALFDGPDNTFMFDHAALEFGLYLNASSLSDAYAQFDSRVRAFFANKPGKLLELDIFAGQGWRELCGFLGRPMPDRPFPHLNTSSR